MAAPNRPDPQTKHTHPVHEIGLHFGESRLCGFAQLKQYCCADVDNLGQAFVAGFDSMNQTLSRAATFSRKLSLFFKLHINSILKNGVFSIDDSDSSSRNVAIIYSGGDDVFVVGAWKDVLEFGVDLYNAFRVFTQGTLTLSAGFGLFKTSYPISYIASQTGGLEDISKNLDGKNAITLFDENHSYHWTSFINDVIGEKFTVIREFFQYSEDHGKSFLYNLLEFHLAAPLC